MSGIDQAFVTAFNRQRTSSTPSESPQRDDIALTDEAQQTALVAPDPLIAANPIAHIPDAESLSALRVPGQPAELRADQAHRPAQQPAPNPSATQAPPEPASPPNPPGTHQSVDPATPVSPPESTVAPPSTSETAQPVQSPVENASPTRLPDAIVKALTGSIDVSMSRLDPPSRRSANPPHLNGAPAESTKRQHPGSAEKASPIAKRATPSLPDKTNPSDSVEDLRDAKPTDPNPTPNVNDNPAAPVAKVAPQDISPPSVRRDDAVNETSVVDVADTSKEPVTSVQPTQPTQQTQPTQPSQPTQPVAEQIAAQQREVRKQQEVDSVARLRRDLKSQPIVPAWEVDRFDLPDSINSLFLESTLLHRIGSPLADASRQGLRSIMVTSAYRGEGRTTTALGLALAGAATGLRVALVDADIPGRKSRRSIGFRCDRIAFQPNRTATPGHRIRMGRRVAKRATGR